MEEQQKYRFVRSQSATASSHNAGPQAGRRKNKVRELFEREGAEVAWVLGLRLGLKEGTLRSWFASWHSQRRRENK
jgi:hypothetical protein